MNEEDRGALASWLFAMPPGVDEGLVAGDIADDLDDLFERFDSSTRQAEAGLPALAVESIRRFTLRATPEGQAVDAEGVRLMRAATAKRAQFAASEFEEVTAHATDLTRMALAGWCAGVAANASPRVLAAELVVAFLALAAHDENIREAFMPALREISEVDPVPGWSSRLAGAVISGEIDGMRDALLALMDSLARAWRTGEVAAPPPPQGMLERAAAWVESRHGVFQVGDLLVAYFNGAAPQDIDTEKTGTRILSELRARHGLNIESMRDLKRRGVPAPAVKGYMFSGRRPAT